MPEDSLMLQVLKEIREDIGKVKATTTDILVTIGLLKYRLDEKDEDCIIHSESIKKLEEAEAKRQTKSNTILGVRAEFVYWLSFIVSVAAIGSNYIKILEWMSK